MTEIRDIAQLAGLLEGEGCFANYPVDGKHYPRIQVQMNDRDVIEWVAALWGSTVNIFTKRYKATMDSYRTTVYGSQALGWMMTLYPFMKSRRQAKIREIIEHARKNPTQVSWKVTQIWETT